MIRAQLRTCPGEEKLKWRVTSAVRVCDRARAHNDFSLQWEYAYEEGKSLWALAKGQRAHRTMGQGFKYTSKR